MEKPINECSIKALVRDLVPGWRLLVSTGKDSTKLEDQAYAEILAIIDVYVEGEKQPYAWLLTETPEGNARETGVFDAYLVKKDSEVWALGPQD